MSSFVFRVESVFIDECEFAQFAWKTDIGFFPLDLHYIIGRKLAGWIFGLKLTKLCKNMKPSLNGFYMRDNDIIVAMSQSNLTAFSRAVRMGRQVRESLGIWPLAGAAKYTTNQDSKYFDYTVFDRE
jgi:hypothetical protein